MRTDEAIEKQAGRDVRLIDLATILLLRWKIAGAIFTAVLLAALLFVLLRSDVFVARTVILPTQEQNTLNTQLAAIAAQIPVGLDVFTPSSSNRDIIEVVLESRSLGDSVVADQRLQERWDLNSPAAARQRLVEITTTETDGTGAITIEVREDNSRLAASIANSYPEQLNRIIARLSDELALRREDFLRRKLAEARGELQTAEERLVEFQQGHAVPEVEEQARQTIVAAAELRQIVMERELKLSQLARIATPENPQYRALASELAGLRRQLANLTGGRRGTSDVFVSLREAPELGVGFARLLREFEEREQMFEILTAGLAQARIDATRDLPVVVVVDPALAPSSPSGRAKAILVVGGFLGLVLGIFGAFVVEGIEQARGNPKNQEFFTAWQRVKKDWMKWK